MQLLNDCRTSWERGVTSLLSVDQLSCSADCPVAGGSTKSVSLSISAKA